MRKPEELFDGIFITPETREKIREAAGERSEKDISQYADDFYNALDKALKMIAVSIPDTKEYIIYTPERRIVVTSEHERDHLRHMAKELGYTEQCIFSLPELKRKLPGYRVRTIIKTETVKLNDIRKQTSDYYIVGIEEV